MIDVTEHAQHTGAIRQHISAKLGFHILGMSAAQVCVKIDSVGHFRHQGFREADRPARIVIFHDGAVGVSAGVRRVVPRAVVVDGPIQELQMAVAAARVVVEEISHAEFPDAQFNSPRDGSEAASPRGPRSAGIWWSSC